ncbi:MAG TPA: sensor histidine kinase [Candidatus Fimivicinus intestinavium]|nr:sensor histidine kinase [Candidatus Fimivicinus intestinavium]
MRELSLNILDIAQNSISAGAKLIEIEIREETAQELLTIRIADDGCGMSPEQLKSVADPFYTTRTTRKVGMGIPLFRMAAEMTGGGLTITSQEGKGTTVAALFHTGHVDFVPLGDVCSTITMLICMNTDRDFLYRRSRDENSFAVDTRELRAILGDVPLDTPEVREWIQDYITEQTQMLCGGAIS